MVENGEILQRTSPEDRNMTFSAAISLIPVFSGIVGGKSYRDFSKAVAAAGQLAGCTDLQLAQAARIKLEGPASEYLDSHPDMEKAGWNKIDEALKSHFQNEPSVEESKARLMKAAQVDGESVREFATRIRLLGCKLLKLVDGDEAGNKVRQDILNQDMLTYFLKGLRADIKRFVHTHQPANLEEATRYAQAEESFLASVEQPMSILTISTPSSDRPISPSPSPPGEPLQVSKNTPLGYLVEATTDDPPSCAPIRRLGAPQAARTMSDSSDYLNGTGPARGPGHRPYSAAADGQGGDGTVRDKSHTSRVTPDPPPPTPEELLSKVKLDHLDNETRKEIEGARGTRVLVDHKPLLDLKAGEDHSALLTRMLAKIMPYSVRLEYLPGSRMPSDALSRVPPEQLEAVTLGDPGGAAPGSAARTVIPEGSLSGILPPPPPPPPDPRRRRRARGRAPMPRILPPALVDHASIQTGQAADEECQNIMSNIRLYPEFQIRNGVLVTTLRERSRVKCNRFRPLVPCALRASVVRMHHHMGHLSPKKTYDNVRANWWFPHMWARVRQEIKSCRECLEKNTPYQVTNAPLQEVPIATRCMEVIDIDLVGPLPKSTKNHEYILSMKCEFSKFLILVPLKKIDSETVCRKIDKHLISKWGTPSVVKSDNAKNLCSNTVNDYLEALRVKKVQILPYQPGGNSVEASHRTIGNMLSKMVSENKRDWASKLQMVALAMNTHVHESHGFQPQEVLTGRPLTYPWEHIVGGQAGTGSPTTYAEVLKKSVREIHATVYQRLLSSSKARLDAKKKNRFWREFAVHDMVLYRDPRLPTGKLSKRKWHGPFIVIKKHNPVSYRIRQADAPYSSFDVPLRAIKTFYRAVPLPTARPKKSLLRKHAQPKRVNKKVTWPYWMCKTRERQGPERAVPLAYAPEREADPGPGVLWQLWTEPPRARDAPVINPSAAGTPGSAQATATQPAGSAASVTSTAANGKSKESREERGRAVGAGTTGHGRSAVGPTGSSVEGERERAAGAPGAPGPAPLVAVPTGTQRPAGPAGDQPRREVSAEGNLSSGLAFVKIDSFDLAQHVWILTIDHSLDSYKDVTTTLRQDIQILHDALGRVRLHSMDETVKRLNEHVKNLVEFGLSNLASGVDDAERHLTDVKLTMTPLADAPQKSKRAALFDGGSTILKWLLGTAKATDLEALSAKIDKTANIQKDLIHFTESNLSVLNATSYLANYNKNQLRRLENATEHIAARLEELAMSFAEDLADVSRRLTASLAVSASVRIIRDVLTNVQLRIAQLEQAWSQTASVKPNSSHLYQFYSFINVAAALVSEDKVRLFLEIPLADAGRRFTAWRAISVPTTTT
ncbi:Retrovirus-related Pol polyprotein from transposon 412 [Frankliniella fusca]|uniref:RNA-directed DNA polymerase n=1 Tax=Frankliniella fusca TaxID=407009 RepID=A0AAE1I166_9NEOP|nr:Retrovirus-related Pol polyprotein from transposon 412 [Frankliniella fusca]